MQTIHETMGMGAIGPASVCDLRLSQMQLASLTAAAFMGIISSSYFWGFITDKKGRRWILLRTIVISLTFSVASMFMVSFQTFFIMRFITGIFVAAPSFVAPTYLSEFFYTKLLARVITHMFMFSAFALIYMPFMNTLFLKPGNMDFEWEVVGSLTIRPWRLLGCAVLLPGVVALILILFLPESPKFLFMIGDTEKGMSVMNWICRKNTGRSLTKDQISTLHKFQRFAQVKRHKADKHFILAMLSDAMPLFRPPFVGTYLGACFVMFVMGMIANGFGLWFTSMRNRNYMRPGYKGQMTFCDILFEPDPGLIMEPDQDLEMVCNDAFIGFADTYYLGILNFTLYNVCWLALFKVPRRAIFLVGQLIITMSGFLLLFIRGNLPQLLALIFLLSPPLVINAILGGALLANVPTYLRAKAMCICLMWARVGAVVGTILTGLYIHIFCERLLLMISILTISKIACSTLSLSL
ncbi:hypothetical protein KR018_007387, partial [Drosophila ironensis]